MKRTVSIIISMMCVASALLFTSCQSDPIVGTWQLVSVRGSHNGIETKHTVIEEYASYNFIQHIEFDKDGSFTDYYASDDSYNSKWTLLDVGVYSIEPYDDGLEKFKFDLLNKGYSNVYVYPPNPEKVTLIDDETIERYQTYEFECDGTKNLIERTTLWKRISNV